MNDLDDELRMALRRVDPSPDFAERVLSRLPAPATNVEPMRARRTRAISWALAAAVAGFAFGGLWLALPGDSVREHIRAAATFAPPMTGTEPPPTIGPPIVKAGPVIPPGPLAESRSRQPRAAAVAYDRVKAERATEQLLLALRVTGDTLSTVQEKVVNRRGTSRIASPRGYKI